MKRIKTLAIVASLFFLTVLVACYVREGVTGHISGLGTVIFGLCGCSLLLLLLLNLLLGISLKRRAIHIIMAVLIIVSFAISPLFKQWRANTLREKFLNVELPVYQSIVGNMNQSVTERAGDLHPLTRIGRLDISSRIDGDGSSTIFFYDDEDWIHGGYMYYNGHHLIPRRDEYIFPGNPNGTGYLHVTNEWYDFYK